MKDLEQVLSELSELKKEHLPIAKRMLNAYGGSFYPFDVFASGILNRSMSLLKGFTVSIPDNFLCAVPLIRLQLDNVLRFSAVHYVDVEANTFALEVMSGKSIRKMKDKTTRQSLTDKFLRDEISKTHPDFADLYDKTCEYVHFSNIILKNTFVIKSVGDEHYIESQISEDDFFIEEQQRVGAAKAMRAVTIKLINQIEDWIYTKENPLIAAKALREGMTHIAIPVEENFKS